MKILIGILLSVVVISGIGLAYSQSDSIPSWIKNTAGYWANNEITDKEFFSVIQFLVDREIITIPNNDNNNQDDSKKVQELENKLSNLKRLAEKNKEQEKTINNLKQKLISLEQKQEIKIIKYTVYDDIISRDFLDLAFSKWIDVNPQLNFINSNETSSLKIKPLPKFLDSSNRYVVHLGTYSEDTNTIYLDSLLNPTLKIQTLSHEFGHYLGLGHSCQENSIYGVMYGKSNCEEDKSYDTVGYNIPSPQCIKISGQIKCR